MMKLSRASLISDPICVLSFYEQANKQARAEQRGQTLV